MHDQAESRAVLRSSRKGLRSVRDEDVEEGSDDNSKEHKQERRALGSARSASGALLLIPLVGLIVFLSTRSSSRGWRFLTLIVSIPLLLAGSVAAGAWQAQPYQRLISGAFVSAIICTQFPYYVSAFMAAVALTAFSLATRPLQTHQESSEDAARRRNAQLAAVTAAFLLVLVLLTDNFFVWVVSATYEPSHNGRPQPLQDNGRLIQMHFFEKMLGMPRREVQRLRATVNAQWALVAALSATFVVCELQWSSKRSLYGAATHAILTLACARIIRVISFLLTVLPSQMPDCYRHHFPSPPPEDWWSWLLVGFLPSTSGGCNDLIVSGHATVTSVLACVSTSVVGHWAFSMALWSMLAFDFLIEVYEGFHYSVDMWMGALFTVMLWRILAPLERTTSDDLHKREFQQTVSLSDIVLYAVPTLGAYLVITVSPRSIVNYWIVLYCMVAVIQAARNGIGHYVQHLLFCVLFQALSIYL